MVGASCNGLGVMVNMLGVPLPECQYHDKEPEHKDDCRIVVHLKLLFGLIFLHGFVPDDFGSGIIVPLIKDKSGNMNDIHNYRPITLTSVQS